VLNNTQGVDLGSYLQAVEKIIKIKWYNLIPESARPPIMKRGQVVIEFAILKDGKITGMKLVSGSGDVALDRGTWGAITASNPVAFSSAPVYWSSSCPARALLLQLQSRFIALGPCTRTSSR
jgi:TonB family protein